MTTMTTKIHPATLAAANRKANAFNDLLARFPGLKDALDTNPTLGMNNFRDDVAHKITTNPAKATDRMVTAFINAVAKDAKFLAARADRLAKDAAVKADALANGVTAPNGRVTALGTIAFVKWKENKFGGAFKMIVDFGNGTKAWMTAPNNLTDWATGHGVALEDFLKGVGIEVTATFEAAPGDPLFAFAKRPVVTVKTLGPVATKALADEKAHDEALQAARDARMNADGLPPLNNFDGGMGEANAAAARAAAAAHLDI